MISIFISSLGISYILSPYVTRLERIVVYRPAATLLAMLCLFLIALIFFFIVVPQVYEQGISFIEKVPSTLLKLHAKLINAMPKLSQHIDQSTILKLQKGFSSEVFSFIKIIAGQILRSTISFINFTLAIILMPVMVFYCLNNWQSICKFINDLIPKKHYQVVKPYIDLVNRNIAGYVRGQVKVCITLGLLYSLFLKIVGLQYSLFIGIATGILSFMPYVGAIFGFLASHLVALSQFDSFFNIALVSIIFISGQIFETFFLTPKLIGPSVDLHPAWVIISIVLAGQFFGFVGILIAIPLASVAKVLLKVLITQYKKSRYYDNKAVTTN